MSVLAARQEYMATLIFKEGSPDETTVESTTYTALSDEEAKTKAWEWATPLLSAETTSLQVTTREGFGIMSVPMEARK